jgi:hypothetical protein
VIVERRAQLGDSIVVGASREVVASRLDLIVAVPFWSRSTSSFKDK